MDVNHNMIYYGSSLRSYTTPEILYAFHIFESVFNSFLVLIIYPTVYCTVLTPIHIKVTKLWSLSRVIMGFSSMFKLCHWLKTDNAYYKTSIMPADLVLLMHLSL